MNDRSGEALALQAVFARIDRRQASSASTSARRQSSAGAGTALSRIAASDDAAPAKALDRLHGMVSLMISVPGRVKRVVPWVPRKIA